MKKALLKEYLNEKADFYNQPRFIETDPIQIPHLFSKKEDIEIIGFLMATIAWGNRKSIIKNGHRLCDIMGNSPYDFVMEYDEKDATHLTFVHRTFNANDLHYFFIALKNIYTNYKGLEKVFALHTSETSTQPAISAFKKLFFSLPHQTRTEKHISDPLKNSAAKRINMYLRWMVRKDNKGVDFGLWNSIAPATLSCPLDVHSGRVARDLKLLKRKQNDGKALLELDTALRKLDPIDPTKYDFALFGLSAFETF
ncbi:hypothetical protein SCB49_11317 [unidentified eubacterium SCB49]|nr:hypothetical protein SCB49_11317 [unidentified eubacterium SCB49]